MKELDDKTHCQINEFCEQADALSEAQDYSSALKKYWQAWDLLPEPQTDWEASTWILAAIGDVNFQSRDFEEGRDNLLRAMHCPDAIGNPFLHLRLGQCQYELGDFDRSVQELMQAYMGGGREILEEDDLKYFKFLTERAKPPLNGW